MYFHGIRANEIVASYGPAYGDAFYFQDGRGNTTHLTDSGNNVVEQYRYFVAGQPSFYDGNGNWMASSAPSHDVRHLFSGASYLPEAGIYDMRNRFYHPNLGRFLQSDPIGFQSGDANLFRYCGGDPVNGRDPTGFYTVVVDGAPLPPLRPDVPFGPSGGIQFGNGGYYRGFERPNRDYVDTIPKDAEESIVRAPPISGPAPAAPLSFLAPTGGFHVSWWPQWLTFPEMPPVDPETAAWTDQGRVPTLIAAGLLAAPALAPETGLYAATAVGDAAAASWVSSSAAVERAAAAAVTAGYGAYQTVLANPQWIVNATQAYQGYKSFPTALPPGTAWGQAGYMFHLVTHPYPMDTWGH